MADHQDIIDIVRRFNKHAKKELDIEKVLLYGSYAKGTANKLSDIDVAVQLAFNNSGNRIEISKILSKIAQKIDDRIEPKLIFSDEFDPDEPASILSNILRTGIEIN